MDRWGVWLAMAIAVGAGGCPQGDDDFTVDDDVADDDDATGDDDDDTGDDDATGDDDTGDDDTGDDDDGPFDHGDPIELVAHDDGGPGGFWEWTDATVLDDGRALLVGVGNIGIYDPAESRVVHELMTGRAYRIDADGGLAALGAREHGVELWDVGDPLDGSSIGMVQRSGPHEDIAVDDGRVLIGWHAHGGVLVGGDAEPLGELPADDAFAVGLAGDRAVLTDGVELVLFDVADPALPVELDRLDLGAEGRDIDFDGARVAVGLGGLGAAVVELDGDALVEVGRLEPPGTALSVALDGEYLWIASWEVVALAWLGGPEPLMLGHEPPDESAMGLGARGGTAIVADWMGVTELARVDGVAGPELVIGDTLWFPPPDPEPAVLSLRNDGAATLHVSLTQPPGYVVDLTELELEPGEQGFVTVEATSGDPDEETLTWTSDDPDEPSGEVRLRVDGGSVGHEHDDFQLEGFAWPDPATGLYSLSDELGRVVFLAYWAHF